MGLNDYKELSAVYKRNPHLIGLECIRCGARYRLDDPQIDLGLGCVICLEGGYPASLQLEYEAVQPWGAKRAGVGLARYADRLPYLDFPSLGEGQTPLVELRRMAPAPGIARLWVKNEGMNPTGSHKDRMSPLAVARAVSLGKDTVVAASSGNAGASLAAYAAAAGIRCVIISTVKISLGWRRAIETAGAELLLVDSPADRWPLMREKVEKDGWYPVTNFLDPPVGSNPFGVEGYKTVAYEILEAFAGEALPTILLVPTSRGDLLWGIYRGLQDGIRLGLCKEIPRLVAVEPAARLSQVLAGVDYRQPFDEGTHDMVSIGGKTVAFQAVSALDGSKGCAVEVSNRQALEAQDELARKGIYAELSAAASLAGLYGLIRHRRVTASDRVVLLCTSHGYKDPASRG